MSSAHPLRKRRLKSLNRRPLGEIVTKQNTYDCIHIAIVDALTTIANDFGVSHASNLVTATHLATTHSNRLHIRSRPARASLLRLHRLCQLKCPKAELQA